uniref:IS30 family transposase n=1 Tax=Levilactobacillus sp. HBUAS70063 TaxID=3109359 RepID=UPI0031332FF5
MSITPEHGTEFLQLADIRDGLKVMIYWPDPYSPEQRGTNENTNGLIREYFPKGKHLGNRTLAEVRQRQKQLNRRPKKALNYRTFKETLFDKALHLV